MTLTSHMEAAEDGLLSLLAGAFVGGAALANGEIPRLGDPGNTPPNEAVWIMEEARADWTPEVTASIPPPTFDEVYELHVKVLKQRAGFDYKPIRDRVRDICQTIELAVAADPTLAGSVRDAWVQTIERASGATEIARVMEATLTIRAWSYLA